MLAGDDQKITAFQDVLIIATSLVDGVALPVFAPVAE